LTSAAVGAAGPWVLYVVGFLRSAREKVLRGWWCGSAMKGALRQAAYVVAAGFANGHDHSGGGDSDED
jgi:hypothetical protein